MIATPGTLRRICSVLLAGSVLAGSIASDVAIGADGGNPFHIEEASISGIQTAILSRKLTASEVVRLYLTRIQAYNGACVNQPQGLLGPISTIPHAGQLNALGTLNLRPAARKAWGFDNHKARSLTDPVDGDPAMPDALEAAAAEDRELSQTGKLVGPLHGVVVALKDQFDTFDMRTTNGTDAAFANDRPPRDSTVAARLRKAGAIVIAKANRGAYQSRSAFGGVVCNPYDTERTTRGSSAGSAAAVSANLVTCAIGEETGTSIRAPSGATNVVGVSPTQELISRNGMNGPGINVRQGPICRTAEDAARIMAAVVGYDEKDPLTAFSIGREPERAYPSYADGGRLDGLRIGVVREFMDKTLFTKADEQAIDIVDRAIGELRQTGATLVDPGPGGSLFDSCFRHYGPLAFGKLFTRQHPDLFPVDAQGKPTTDHIAKLVEMASNPALVPDGLSIRDIGSAPAIGDMTYWRTKYLHDRNDAAIKTTPDFIAKSKPIADPQYWASSANITVKEPYGTVTGPAAPDDAKELDMADRMLQRFAFQQVVLSCMADLHLDALVYPTMNIPPIKIQAPEEPAVNGRNQAHRIIFGQHGFATISVPAGFTTEVYDRASDKTSPDGTRLVGPVAARLPVGVDFAARPFGEPLLFRIASAYEKQTHHRSPPEDFTGLPKHER